jgi:hypothetical protein
MKQQQIFYEARKKTNKRIDFQYREYSRFQINFYYIWKKIHMSLIPKLLVILAAYTTNLIYILTPKGPRPFFGPFLKFGQAIVDVIFVQKISNFR